MHIRACLLAYRHARVHPYMHTRMHHNHMLEHRQVQTFPCPPPEPDIGSGSSCLTGHRDQYFMRFRRVMKLCKRLGGWVSGTDATSNHGRHGAACSNISKPTPRGKTKGVTQSSLAPTMPPDFETDLGKQIGHHQGGGRT